MLGLPQPKSDYFWGRHYETLSAISGAEEHQEKPVPCPKLRQREHRQAWLAGGCVPIEANAQPRVPAQCLGCGNEPGSVGVLCPTTCSGTMASVATRTLGAPTLSPEVVLGALLACPWSLAEREDQPGLLERWKKERGKSHKKQYLVTQP